jgi:YD repeat-containing protein
MKLPNMLDDHFSRIALALYCVVAAVVILVSTVASHAGSTVQRDAPTTRFYDARGNVTGSASTYGNTTKFYAPNGSPVGSTTRNGSR